MPTGEEHAEAGRRWRREWFSRICEEITPWSHGLVVRSRRHPDFWEYNSLRVHRDPGGDAALVMRAADAALGDCAHRFAGFQMAISPGMRNALEHAGWMVTPIVWMRHKGEPSPAAADVVEVAYEEVHDLRAAWHVEDFGEDEVGGYWEQAREVAALAGARVLAVRRGGAPVGFAQVEVHGDGAEISQVFVSAEHRGGGIGGMLTSAAIRLARELAGAVWISADAEDRPRQLYARLGFQPVWLATEAILTPAARRARSGEGGGGARPR